MAKKKDKKNNGATVKLHGMALWTAGKTCQVGTAIAELSDGHFLAAYSEGSTKGNIDVKKNGSDDFAGKWSEKGDGSGACALRLALGQDNRHVFVGTWAGSGGPGHFVFDLAVGEPPVVEEAKKGKAGK